MNKKGTFFCAELVMKNKEPYIRLFGRWSDKTKMDITVKADKPYFYILKAEENLIDFACSKEDGFKSYKDEELIKVTVNNPFNIKGWRDNPGYIEKFSRTFESDLPLPTRFMIDHGLYSGIEWDGLNIKPCDVDVEPRTMNLDVEVDYVQGANREMNLPLISISFYDSYTDTIYCLAYHKDAKPGQTITDCDTEIIKNVDGSIKTCKLKTIIVADEKDLLQLFKSFVLHFDTDIFLGWHLAFDMMYICKRMEALGMDPAELSPIKKYFYKGESAGNNSFKSGKHKMRRKEVMIRGRTVIDILAGYRRIRWKQIASFKLDSVSQEEFKTGKVEYTGSISDFWKNDFKRFLEYNVKDVIMTEAINQKYSIVQALLGIRNIAGCELSDILMNSRIWDVYILRLCKDKTILPSKVFRNDEGSDNKLEIEGGYVLEPVVGLHKNIVILDLKALYQNIMLAFNTSAETIENTGEIIVGNGTRIKKKDGILKQALIKAGAERDRIRAMLKDPAVLADENRYLNIYKRQYLLKTWINSAYGASLYSGFRLYNPAMGAAITFVGRTLIKKIQEYCISKGYKVLRMDTDSNFVDVNAIDAEDAVKKGKQLEKEINDMFPEWFKENNIDSSYFSIKFEKLYGLFYSGEEKKLYGGKIIWDWEAGVTNEIELKGVAAVKSDRSSFSRKLQRTIFENILNEDKSFNILKFIYEEIDKFYCMKYKFEEIGIPKALTQDISDYATDNPYVRGARWSMKNIIGYEFYPKPYLLYIKEDSKYQTDVICFNSNNEVPKDIKIDMEKMLMNSCYKIVEKQLIMLKLDPQLIESYIKNKCQNQNLLSQYIK